MSTPVFTKATKKRAKLRLLIDGPAGGGKSYSGLRIGTELARHCGGRLAAIDTEHGRLSKYSDEFDFDVIQLENFHPDSYIAAMAAAVEGGYSVLLIDSASHEWIGKGGCLELNTQIANTRFQGNTYAAWSVTTPIHNKFIEAIHRAPVHVVATMRSKMEYAMAERAVGNKTRTSVEKVGLAPQTRDGVEYEFDFILAMHPAKPGAKAMGEVSKTTGRKYLPQGEVVEEPGEEFARLLIKWLEDGVADEPEADVQSAAQATAVPSDTPQAPVTPDAGSGDAEATREVSTPPGTDSGADDLRKRVAKLAIELGEAKAGEALEFVGCSFAKTGTGKTVVRGIRELDDGALRALLSTFELLELAA